MKALLERSDLKDYAVTLGSTVVLAYQEILAKLVTLVKIKKRWF